MSSCNDYAEFVAHLTLATGAPPHLVLPLARRLRRLATTHQRRCKTQCNGCPRCDGFSPRAGVWIAPTHPPATEEDRYRCPTCSLDTIEDAIAATCEELTKLRHSHERPLDWSSDSLRPIFQDDPRGATVRLMLPTHREGDYGLPVPTSTR